MKYIGFFILALMRWNSWGLKFTCEGGQAGFQQLQWEVQNYQCYDSVELRGSQSLSTRAMHVFYLSMHRFFSFSSK